MLTLLEAEKAISDLREKPYQLTDSRPWSFDLERVNGQVTQTLQNAVSLRIFLRSRSHDDRMYLQVVVETPWALTDLSPDEAFRLTYEQQKIVGLAMYFKDLFRDCSWTYDEVQKYYSRKNNPTIVLEQS